MSVEQPLLSAEMIATAAAIRDLRNRINRMIAEGTLPEDKFPAASKLLIDGHVVALALEELAR